MSRSDVSRSDVSRQVLSFRVRLPHVLTCFCGIIGPSGPFTPRFGVFSWGFCPSGSVYPTFWRVFVGLSDLRVRLPHVLACFRGAFVLPGPFTPRFDVFSWDFCTSGLFTPRFDVFSWDYWTFGSVYHTFWRVFVGLLSFRVRLPHVLACFRGVIVLPGPFSTRFGVFSWDYWTFGAVYPTI